MWVLHNIKKVWIVSLPIWQSMVYFVYLYIDDMFYKQSKTLSR